MKLRNETLEQIPSSVKRPHYNRADLIGGWIHIGLGNFHRAHQSWYLHRLMQQGKALDWAIIGAGIRSYDAAMREKLLEQDCLTTLVELGPTSKGVEIVGSMIDYLPITPGNQALIEAMTSPAIRIVSTTITEGGYYIHPATKDFDADHQDIQHDIANPGTPCTVFGAIVAALRLRKERGIGPFTCQSCDNIQGNGRIMRQSIVSLARLIEEELADWIDNHCTFPNSMVDCIVPATGDKEKALVQQLGIDDQAPVTHESFHQWVIEDSFCAGRPQWEEVGATFTDTVHEYESMKIRILNGGHQVIAAAGDLLGIPTISGAMEHSAIETLFAKVEQQEIVPHVHCVPEYTPQTYYELIHKRFSNPDIVDTTRRVAFDGSSRQPGFVLPSVHDCLAAGIAPNGLALVSAIWARYCFGQREDGSTIEPNDPHWEKLHKCAIEAKAHPKAWLEMRQTYGDLADNPAFAEPFGKWLDMLYNQGVADTLQHYTVGK